MASKYAQVNVKFNADISQFSTAMQNAAREMKKAGDQLQSVGKYMTMNLTAPIVALGAAALYSFGQIDALKRGLISFSGSAKLAEEEFTKLREVAKLPGIGLEEAVEGSINLQAIGMSADDARIAMKAFGNAIATVGGGKESFDLAIRGFSQLTNASKPLQQDLYQIANQLPQVNKLMIEAFGTNRAEDLAKMGISGKQLAQFLVDELGKLPAVSGGIKNAFENMSDSVKISLASFGEVIEKNFDISGKITALSDWLNKLINTFSRLDPKMQGFILGWVAIAAAIGPVLLALGAVVQIFPTFLAGIAAIRTAIVALNTGALAPMAAALVGVPGLFVAIVGAVGLAIISLMNWDSKVSETTKRLKAEREAAKKLKDDIEKEQSPFNKFKKAEINVKSVKEEKGTYEDFRKGKQPEEKGEYIYMGDVDTSKEKSNIKDAHKKLSQTELDAITKKNEERRAYELEQSKLNGEATINKWEEQTYYENLGYENFVKSNEEGFVDVGNTIDEGGNYLSDRWKEIAYKNREDLRLMGEQAKESLQRLNMDVKQALEQGLVMTIQDTFAQIGENIAMKEDPFKDVGKNILNSLGKLMSTIGGAMIAFGIHEIMFEEGVITLNGPQALAAGIGMAAAGALISATARKGLKGQNASSSEYTGNSGNSGSTDLQLHSRLDGRDIVMSGQTTTYVQRR